MDKALKIYTYPGWGLSGLYFQKLMNALEKLNVSGSIALVHSAGIVNCLRSTHQNLDGIVIFNPFFMTKISSTKIQREHYAFIRRFIFKPKDILNQFYKKNHFEELIQDRYDYDLMLSHLYRIKNLADLSQLKMISQNIIILSSMNDPVSPPYLYQEIREILDSVECVWFNEGGHNTLHAPQLHEKILACVMNWCLRNNHHRG